MSSSYDGRTFGPAEDSAFAMVDKMVEPEKSGYEMHPQAHEMWGRNLDGVDPEATVSALNAAVVSTKAEAESLLEHGTRRPKTLGGDQGDSSPAGGAHEAALSRGFQGS